MCLGVLCEQSSLSVPGQRAGPAEAEQGSLPLGWAGGLLPVWDWMGLGQQPGLGELRGADGNHSLPNLGSPKPQVQRTERWTTAAARRITEQSKFSGQLLLEITRIREKAWSSEQLGELAV